MKKITRKQMFKRCIDIYNENPEIVFELLNIEELDLLFSIDINSTFKYNSKYSTLINTFLLSYDSDLEYLSITEELVDVVKYCKKQYLIEKEKIERDKEKYHFIVGLFRVFGALTKKEISYILKEFNLNYRPSELLNSPYTKRFIDYDWSSFYEEYSLKEISMYKYELLDTHPKKIRLKHNYKQYVEVGKHYFVKSSPEYKKLMSHPKLFDFYNSIDKNALILYKGCGLGNRYFDYLFGMFLNGLDEEEKTVFLTFFELLPTYVLQKNQDNILSDNDGKLLYNILFHFKITQH